LDSNGAKRPFVAPPNLHAGNTKICQFGEPTTKFEENFGTDLLSLENLLKF
jgi:hypothetical protein